MKKIIYILMTLLFISFVRADTDIDLIAVTSGDMDFNADLNAGGDIDLTIDGMNFDKTVNDLYENDMSMKGVYWWLSRIFMEKDYKNDWFIVNPFKLDKYEQRFRWVMDTYFVPRTEVNEMNNYYESRITDLSLRIEALEKVLGEEKVLKGRLNVAKDYNLTSLTYDGTTYRNTKDGFISLKTIEQPEVNETIEINETEEPKEDKRIKIWQDLCDKGIKKFCVILEQRGYNLIEEPKLEVIEVMESIELRETV